MSWDGVVRFAASTLPRPVRDRYLEEWLGDVAAAASAGVSPASIAAGALVFSATLDRDVPSISGMPVPARSRYHARWSLLLLATVAFVMFPLRGIVPGLENAWLPVVLPLLVVAVWRLWRAARLSGALGRLAAALTTVALAIFVAGMATPPAIWDAIPGYRLLYPAAFVMLVAAAVLGAWVWLLHASSARARVLALAGLAAAAAVVVASNFTVVFVPPYVVGVAVLLAAMILAVRAHRRTAAADASGGARTLLVVAVATVVLLGGIAYGAFEALVLHPMAIAPGRSLEAIYELLPASALTAAIGDVVWWGALSTLGAGGFLVIGIAFARKPLVGDRRIIAMAASALLAAVLMTSSLASVALTTGVAEAVMGSRWGSGVAPTVGYVVAVLALLAALVGAIVPRAPAAQTTAAEPAR